MYRFILVINIYSLRNWSGNVLYISVSRNFYIVFFFRTPFRDSVSSFQIQYFTAAIFAIKMCISIQKNFFRWSSNYVFIVKEIRQRRALQAYAIKETTGNIQRSDLYEATRCRMKLTCETIFMIDIDEMLPKLLHRLKYASIYLNKIQNVLTKQQGSTV